jgi:bifunctional UDP-N-acetylglucosamine pyrophosphorylase/glucosamine-1-phosphate N-acetyltransferase
MEALAEPAPAVLILAAGRGTRMKSALPKVLHPLMGRPILEHVLNAALYLNPARLVVVTGFGAEAVEDRSRAFLASSAERPGRGLSAEPICARQTEQLGTGHAVAMAKDALADFSGPLLIMAGDVPLISPNTLDGFLKAHQALGSDLSVLTVRLDDPAAYGRVIRDEAGWLARIVEYRDADEEERRVEEINSGLYLADAANLYQSIERLSPDNDQREYYLTDVVADFRGRGLLAAAVEIPSSLSYEVCGINDRAELAAAQGLLKARVNEAWLRAGVTMLDPFSTLIETTVRLGADVTLWPGVILTGRTTVGAGAEIGPFCRLDDCRVEAGARVPGGTILKNQAFGPETGD